MQIELKDIIKPKFAIGQTVFIRKSDGSVMKGEVYMWEMSMRSDQKGPKFIFLVKFVDNWWAEKDVFATAEEAFNAKN